MNKGKAEAKNSGSRSPRAPSLSLADALEKVMVLYSAKQLHAVPLDIAAKHIGYKNAKSGAALTTIASLRYFGLLERPQKGQVNVSKDVEIYKYSPDPKEKKGILEHWLQSPDVFKDLFEKYGDSAPTLETITYSLIRSGFRPNTANSVSQAFVESLHYIKFEFGQQSAPYIDESEKINFDVSPVNEANFEIQIEPNVEKEIDQSPSGHDVDKILVRLSGGRRAWLVLPTKLYERDKKRIKAQLDVVLADDEDFEE